MKLRINLADQTLELLDDNDVVMRRYPVSTAANGPGEEAGSYQTPRGRHIVRAKIGADQPLNTVFSARRPTGEIYEPALGETQPERDWILSRILWLSGAEPGFNRLGNRDTMRRYIYSNKRRARMAASACVMKTWSNCSTRCRLTRWWKSWKPDPPC